MNIEQFSKHPIMNTNRDKNQDKHHDIPCRGNGLGRHKVREEVGRNAVQLVARAHKDEGGEQQVHDRIVRDQHEHAVRVGAQPDVVLEL